MKRSTSTGFTLVELLVVIAIIGLLATFAVTQLSGARDKAKLAKGAAQEGQILRAVGDDIVGRWDFNECSGTSAVDSSGYNHSGTYTGGATYSTDIASGSGCSISFDGSGYVTVLPSSDFDFPAGQDFTIGFWLKTSVVSDTTRAFIARFFSGAGPGYGARGNGAANQIEFWSSPDTTVTCTSCNYSDNKWHYIVIAREGATKKIYFDGSVAASGSTTSNSLSPSGQPLYFGTRATTASITGLMNDVRIYRRSISSKEIREMYADGLPKHVAKE